MIRDDNGTHADCPFPSHDHKEFVPLEVKSGALAFGGYTWRPYT
ncbi:hypothetical protein ACP4OV_001786 [Aristida adscensionis]